MPRSDTVEVQAERIGVRSEARPFLKWVGGKGQLLAQLRPLLPSDFGTYFEPFVGGGALFFDLGRAPASLSDVNAELINCYRVVRDDVEALILALRPHRYESAHYYRVRALDPESLTSVERAARTIFLNKTGYNGLYRVNRGGGFNVPFGRYTNPTICDAENLRACSERLQGVEVSVSPFEGILEKAKPGDFVYFDPPYVPVSRTSYFTAYSPGGFGWTEQQKLAKVFRRLAQEGVQVVLSNSDTPEVRALYHGFKIESVQASRSVNANGARRGKVGEVVVSSVDREAASRD